MCAHVRVRLFFYLSLCVDVSMRARARTPVSPPAFNATRRRRPLPPRRLLREDGLTILVQRPRVAILRA